MSAIAVFLVGALGLFVGSAVWVAARARAYDRPLLAGPVCANPACGAPLPLAAWLPLLGSGTARRCRVCGAEQPDGRVVFELAVAIYFALAADRVGDDPERLAAALLFAAPLLILLLIDVWTRVVHTDVIGVAFGLALVLAALDGFSAVAGAVVGAVCAAVVFALFSVVVGVLPRSPRAVPFGMADGYLAAAIGAMVRFPDVIQALFFGVLIAAVAALLLRLGRAGGRRVAIGYGPWLCLGALVTLAR